MKLVVSIMLFFSIVFVYPQDTEVTSDCPKMKRLEDWQHLYGTRHFDMWGNPRNYKFLIGGM